MDFSRDPESQGKIKIIGRLGIFCQFFGFAFLAVCLLFACFAMTKKINGMKDDLEIEIQQIKERLSASIKYKIHTGTRSLLYKLEEKMSFKVE